MRRIDLKRANVARPNTVRDINRQIVLNLIREKEPISRGEIAQQTALHRATISTILDELLSEDLIEEIRAEEFKGGRPPMLLRLRAGAPVAVGVDMGTARTMVATADLAGRVLQQEEFATDPDSEETLRRVAASILRLVGKNKMRIEGIGLSLPGLVDHETGNALFIPHFKWRDWPVAREIEAATGLPVAVDNDANAAALAELWFGRPEVRGVRDFVLVLVAEGIGTGIVFDGQIYRGVGGGAGEFGHTTIGEGAPIACAAGSRRCWEAFASERAALARYKKLRRGPAASSEPNFTQLIASALGGEAAARTALVQTAHYLGLGISNLISGLGPEAVIIGGPIARAWPLIVSKITQVVEENYCLIQPSVRIIASTLGEQPKLLGAFSLVLASKFAVTHSG